MAQIELKQPIVQEISETIADAKAVMLVKYLGLTVEQDTALRKDLRKAGVEYKVFKNTLMNLAFKGTECEALSKDLQGPNALAVSKTDATAPARVLAAYDKKFKCFNFVSGVIEGQYADADELRAVAEIPSREVLLGRLFGSMQSPIANFARVIKQIAEKDGAPAEEAAPEAAPAE